MDLDFNFNLVNAKSFSSTSFDNYSSFNFDELSNGKKVVAIKTAPPWPVYISNHLCVNNQLYSGIVIMIF